MGTIVRFLVEGRSSSCDFSFLSDVSRRRSHRSPSQASFPLISRWKYRAIFNGNAHSPGRNNPEIHRMRARIILWRLARSRTIAKMWFVTSSGIFFCSAEEISHIACQRKALFIRWKTTDWKQSCDIWGLFYYFYAVLFLPAIWIFTIKVEITSGI